MLPYDMSSFKDLDAFQACHQLTLATHRVNLNTEDDHGRLGSRLRAAAIVATSRIARGSGFGDRQRFLSCVDRTAAALAEFEAYLELARELELIAAEDHRELESLGGRALFYVSKLALSLEPPKAGPTSSDSCRSS